MGLGFRSLGFGELGLAALYPEGFFKGTGSYRPWGRMGVSRGSGGVSFRDATMQLWEKKHRGILWQECWLPVCVRSSLLVVKAR